MKRDWKPGDVALAYDDDWSFRVVRHSGSPDYWSAANGVWPQGVSGDLLDYRPLVVLDPEHREQVERLLLAFDYAPDAVALALDDMQAALRSFVTPPKPDEPTKWGVVEARCVHSESRRTWVRNEDGNWYPLGGGPADDWDSLKEPVVIREGVAS